MENHVHAIQEWPLPSLKTHARVFLGMTVYYRNHIPDYDQIAAPWTDMIRNTDKEQEK